MYRNSSLGNHHGGDSLLLHAHELVQDSQKHTHLMFRDMLSQNFRTWFATFSQVAAHCSSPSQMIEHPDMCHSFLYCGDYPWLGSWPEIGQGQPSTCQLLDLKDPPHPGQYWEVPLEQDWDWVPLAVVETREALQLPL